MGLLEDKRRARHFYRFLSAVYDRVNPFVWTEAMRAEAERDGSVLGRLPIEVRIRNEWTRFSRRCHVESSISEDRQDGLVEFTL
jgi:hypothetical protein